jgi:hypothetical protein
LVDGQRETIMSRASVEVVVRRNNESETLLVAVGAGAMAAHAADQTTFYATLRQS